MKRILTYCLLLTLLLACLQASADKNNIDTAINAVQKQDFASAVRIFSKLAQQGNAEAQHNLAILYRQGKGVARDDKQAFKWFQAAADQGLPDAQFYTGYCYDKGQGVAQDAKQAVSWYQKAAEHGNALAQTNLAVAYANGDGVKQDIILAYVWFSLAASQGVSAALENRNALKKVMSAELSGNAQRLTRNYFEKYVAPYQNQNKNNANKPHPQGNMNQPPASDGFHDPKVGK